MSDLKTKPTTASVAQFLKAIKDKARRDDCLALVELMSKATGAKPQMWGSSIVGFGAYHYVYASGREGDWFLVGFSPRKQNLTLYLTGGFEPHAELLAKLGKYKLGKGCLYLNALADVDRTTLRKLISQSVKHIRQAAA